MPVIARYRNPVIDTDFPDPSILAAPVDGWWWAHSTQHTTIERWAHVPVARSRDLVSLVFEERAVPPATLLAALDADWAGAESLRGRFATEGPRVGNADPAADGLLRWPYDRFADACETAGPILWGGIVRPGTGSAMYCLWLGRGREGLPEPVVGATADGRHQGEPFSANLAPSPGARVAGPLTVLRSFAGIDYGRVCNGGPVTMELSASVFGDAEGIEKTALLVRAFARMGCQQLQLNALDAATLLDARAHPERHRDLIVRVWGWSGYFCELPPEYQEHVLARHLYSEAAG